MTDEKIMTKIKALLNLAERAGSDAEAENARNKATEMMLRYSIDEAAVQEREHRREELVSRTINVEGYAKAKLYLMHSVAAGMGLKSFEWSNDRRGWSNGSGQVFGWESDVAAFDVLFSSLIMQANREADRAWANYKGFEHGRKFRQSFLVSFANTVGYRLRQQRQQVIAESDASTPGTALAVIDRDKAVEVAYLARNTDLRKGTAVTNSSSLGARAGRDAGQRANLGGTPGIGTSHRAIGR